MLTAAAMGFVIGFSQILAIGPQNAFVLRQGLTQSHVFWVCLACTVSDAALVGLGVLAIDMISANIPWATTVLTWGGIVFLVCYGAFSFSRAFQPDALWPAKMGTGSLRVALMTCLALAWLNPHVYVDTIVLIGTVSSGFASAPDKIAYLGGAILASMVFFFGLGYAARFLAPVFRRPHAWSALDVGSALVMWTIAANLALFS